MNRIKKRKLKELENCSSLQLEGLALEVPWDALQYFPEKLPPALLNALAVEWPGFAKEFCFNLLEEWAKLRINAQFCRTASTKKPLGAKKGVALPRRRAKKR